MVKDSDYPGTRADNGGGLAQAMCRSSLTGKALTCTEEHRGSSPRGGSNIAAKSLSSPEFKPKTVKSKKKYTRKGKKNEN